MTPDNVVTHQEKLVRSCYDPYIYISDFDKLGDLIVARDIFAVPLVRLAITMVADFTTTVLLWTIF